jgi:AcrR family transcriptional regulator
MINSPPSASRHARRRAQTRNLLVQSALALVLERGYEAITIQDITERADLGRGTFYIHFKDKEEAVWAAFQDLFQQLEQTAHQKLDRRLPQVEYYGLLNIFQHAARHRDLYRVMFGGQGSARLAARAQDYLAAVFLHDIRNAAQPAEPDFHLPAEFEAQFLVGVLGRLLYWWLETSQDYTPDQIASMTYIALYRKAPPPHSNLTGLGDL